VSDTLLDVPGVEGAYAHNVSCAWMFCKAYRQTIKVGFYLYINPNGKGRILP